MADAAVERLVNLAFLLAGPRRPVSAALIRAEVPGYSPDQDDAAFGRMFERDKDALRSSGFVIGTTENSEYFVDTSETFASTVDLSAVDAATLRAVGAAMLEDPGFPFAEDLTFALAKIAGALDLPVAPAIAHTTDEDPEEQGRRVALLDRAVTARKVASFDYTNARDEHKHHTVEPYGLFCREGRWYLVARDTELDEPRVYAVARMDGLLVNTAKERSADYQLPEDFDVASFVGLPFQYGNMGPERHTLRFAPSEAWRATTLAGGREPGELHEDGSRTWRVPIRDRQRLLRWLVEHGPGVTVTDPATAQAELRAGLEAALAAHREPDDSPARRDDADKDGE